MQNTSVPQVHKECVIFADFNCTGPTQVREVRLVLLVVFAIFITATILGNLLIITAIASFTKLQTHANFLALSLAVSDLLVGVFIMPLSMMKTVYDCWFYASVLCNAHYFLDYTLTTATILHITCIAYDRYVAICDPLRYPTRVTVRTIAGLLVLCWLGAAIFSSPILLSFSPTLSRGNIERASCPDDCVFSVSFGILVTIGMGPYFTAIHVVLLMYAVIYRVARRQSRKVAAEAASSSAADSSAVKNMKREHSAAKTLGAIIGTFMLSWLPYYVVAMMSFTVDGLFIPYRVAMWIGYCSSAINPLLYASFNRPFRTAFRDIFRLRVFSGVVRRDSGLSERSHGQAMAR
ncbi:trace amine-associated receptor 3-like [Lethenteron reissneri]|uniref:trace amine-associated receptor 3-like n=1 Tax=Lethenteron reissneri TaxID=7753 RepID=UPI002AB7C593|nr:trace amine-associated receptor 3-like [Lethenteron reissneri]